MISLYDIYKYKYIWQFINSPLEIWSGEIQMPKNKITYISHYVWKIKIKEIVYVSIIIRKVNFHVYVCVKCTTNEKARLSNCSLIISLGPSWDPPGCTIFIL